MAVVFDKDLDNTKLLFAYNNNTVRFRSDDLVKIPKTAQLIGLGIDVLLYPHPNGKFYFNYKEYVSALINTRNFVDDFAIALNPVVPSTFRYDVTDGFYMEGTVDYKINYTDGTSDVITSSMYRFLAAVENIETKRNRIVVMPLYSQYDILSPVRRRFNGLTGDDIYLKYWKGYPFEYSFYKKEITDDVVAYNHTTVTSYTLLTPGNVTSMFLSDGLNEMTYAGLQLGFNNFKFEINGNEMFTRLNVECVDEGCGIYVKFLNQFGRYNYWLFSKNYFRNRSSKYLAEIENDFEDLEDTISPTLQFGKNSDSTIKCAAKNLTATQRLILEGIIDSPKILMFTGTPGQASTNKDWMEVKLKTTSFPIEAPNKKLQSFYLELDLPARNVIGL